MFFSTAHAQTAGAPDPAALSQPDIFSSVLPIILIFAVFWFLLLRPQQKKMKEHRAMVAALKRGDKIVTSGGIIGTVTKVVSDTELQLEIADGVQIRILRGTVSDILNRTAESKSDKPESGKSKTEIPKS